MNGNGPYKSNIHLSCPVPSLCASQNQIALSMIYAALQYLGTCCSTQMTFALPPRYFSPFPLLLCFLLSISFLHSSGSKSVVTTEVGSIEKTEGRVQHSRINNEPHASLWIVPQFGAVVNSLRAYKNGISDLLTLGSDPEPPTGKTRVKWHCVRA